MLKEIVEKGHYCFVEKVDSWQDAIRQSYAPLLKDNTVENENLLPYDNFSGTEYMDFTVPVCKNHEICALRA